MKNSIRYPWLLWFTLHIYIALSTWIKPNKKMAHRPSVFQYQPINKNKNHSNEENGDEIFFCNIFFYHHFYWLFASWSVSQSNPSLTPLPKWMQSLPSTAEHNCKCHECSLISWRLYSLAISYSLRAPLASCLLAKIKMGTFFKCCIKIQFTSWMTTLKS